MVNVGLLYLCPILVLTARLYRHLGCRCRHLGLIAHHCYQHLCHHRLHLHRHYSYILFLSQNHDH